MFIRQTDYQVSQCVYGKAGRGVPERRRLAVVLYFLFPSFPLYSLISLARAISLFFPCAAHLYPPALRGGRLLGFDFFFLFPSHIRLCSSHLFFIRLQSSSSSSSSPPATTSSSYLSAKISWSNVETDEGNEQNDLVLAAHRGAPGKGKVGRGRAWGGFILEHRLDGQVGFDECTHTRWEVISSR